MSEVLYNVIVPVVDATPITVEVPLHPQVLSPWALQAIPIDTGPADATDIEFSLVQGGILGIAPLVTTVAMVDNKLNRYEQTEVGARLSVTLTPGATAPDGGVRLQLIGTRESS